MTSNLVIRWTFGEASGRPTSLQGLDMLECSIRFANQLFPDAKKVVCYNSIKSRRLLTALEQLRVLGLDLINQESLGSPFLNVGGKNSFWKYLPERIDEDKYELFLDNDVVIWTIPLPIQEWLTSNSILISEDWNGSFYGEFQSDVNSNRSLNAGIIGLPPKFRISLPDTTYLKDFFHSEQGFAVSKILESRLPIHVIAKELVYQSNHFVENRIAAHLLMNRFSIGHFCGCTYAHYFEWDKYFKDEVWNRYEISYPSKYGIL